MPRPVEDAAPVEAVDAGGAVGPVVSAGYAGAIGTLTQTWLAGVPLVVLLVAMNIVIPLVIVLVVVVLGVLSGLSVQLGMSAFVVVSALSLFVYVAAVAVLLVAMTALMAPPLQALYRAHYRHLRDNVDLSVSDGIRGAFASHSLNAFLVAAMTLELLGYVVLLVPGLLVSAALSFVAPAMVVHDLPLGAAIRRSLMHFWQAPLWHVSLSLVDLLVAGGLSASLPFVGGLLVLPMSTQLNLQAYLAAYPAVPDVLDG